MVLADAGALYALVDRDDPWHDRVRSWWEAEREPVRVPVTVVPEVTYLLGEWIGARAELDFAREIVRGEFMIEDLREADVRRAADVMAVYLDSPIGFVDASIVAMAERLGVTRILTTDRRHFGLVRPSHVPAFELVP
ncbi:MAG: PIN domain-containing protein [Gemmatimonadetes bacterium]|nr:PIN domain-containing protein [Gemmatimonadota bacterium]